MPERNVQNMKRISFPGNREGDMTEITQIRINELHKDKLVAGESL